MFYKVVEVLKTSWKESVESLKPQSLGRLGLLSLRTFLQIYTAVPFAWFFPTALFAGLLFSEFSLVYAFYVVLIARAARPSIEYKRVSYWQYFTPADWILFAFVYSYKMIPSVFSLGESPLFLGFYHGVAKLFLLEGLSWFEYPLAFKELIPFLSPFIIMWALFMLDAQKTVGQYLLSFFRAVGILVYNYPFFFFTYIVMRLMLATGPLFHQFIPVFFGKLFLYGVFIPLYIAFLTNFYVKRIHEQFGLYYRA